MKTPVLHRFTPSRRSGRLALIAAAALSLPFLMPAPTASAGDVQWSVTVGSGGGSHHRQRHDNRGHHRGGYTKQVYHPPVYRTRYDDCGRAFRVCIRAGYYEQVYVSASYQTRPQRRYQATHRQSTREHYTRSRSDYNRRGQWGNRGSNCGY